MIRWVCQELTDEQRWLYMWKQLSGDILLLKVHNAYEGIILRLFEKSPNHRSARAPLCAADDVTKGINKFSHDYLRSKLSFLKP